MTSNTVERRSGARRRTSWIRYAPAGLIAIGVCTAIGMNYWTSPAAADLTPPPPPYVTVSIPLQERLAGFTQFTGQFSALDDVDIRAQVSGYLTEIDFTDGQIVHKGDLLFVIDPRPFAIQLQQADAAVLTAKAQLLLAQKETQRVGSLQNSGAVTREQLDERVAAQATAQAALMQATADVASAQLELDYCHIRAPITGRISVHRVSVGNLVIGGANGSTLLTTLVSLDPIHLDFQMNEDDYLNYERYLHGGRAVDNSVQAALSDESGYPRNGHLDFIDNAIDTATGTIHARAVFPNHDLMITPGDFAELRLPTSAAVPVLLVPDSAVLPDQSDELVMTVAPDGTVVPKVVQTGGLQGGLREIEAGLGRNDRVIIDGLIRATPGAKVTPKQGKITQE